MGDSSSKEISVDLLVQSVQKFRSELSERDRRLFNHGKFALAEEEEQCNNCELFIDFEDRDSLIIQTNNNPSGRIFIGYDENDQPKYVWDKLGIKRACKRFFVKCWRYLRNAASNTFAAITGSAKQSAIEN